MVKQDVVLQGLDAVNSPAKGEASTQGHEDVNRQTVNFTSQKLTFEAVANQKYAKTQILSQVPANVDLKPEVPVGTANQNRARKRVMILDGLG